MISNVPRVRFAPSPTGYLHVGGLRTALYNFLFAKNNNGKFILRIEDTDRNRFVEGAVENLISTLNWAGLNYDEGPGKAGNFGPYLQSERLEIYHQHIKTLIDKKNAYYCFCTQQRLNQIREEQQRKGLQPKYDKHCLTISSDEIEKNLKNNVPHVIRMNIKPGQKISIKDIIRGNVEFESGLIDDQILIKSDGYPTYHFANVVDDHLMKITHVIRGEEWLSSTPKHVLLYDFFNWEKPDFAHLPLLLNPDRSKLSKRQGDVAVEDYIEKGYLKEALINFVALLGWNAGDDKEFYLLDELIKKFSLERVNKSGAVFNVEKLNWLNAEHLRYKSNEEIIVLLKEEFKKSKVKSQKLKSDDLYSKLEIEKFSNNYLSKVIEAMKERVTFVKDFLEKSSYFFEAPSEYDENVIKKRWKAETPDQLKKLSEEFLRSNPVSKEDFEKALHKTAEELNISAGKLIHPVRLAVSGLGTGPGVFDLLHILGKDEILERINKAIENIKVS